MPGGRRSDQKKGIFCLETDRWYGTKDRSSVAPILDILGRLKNHEVPYLHKGLATRAEMEHSLDRYLQPTFKTHPILYLAFHGYPASKGQQSGLWLGEDDLLPLGELADLMAGRCGNRIIYFGACWAMATDGRRLNSFLHKTEAKAVCGYKEEVDWVESTAFDLLFLGKIQSATLRRRDSLKRFDEKLRETAPRLYRDLGFRMVVR